MPVVNNDKTMNFREHLRLARRWYSILFAVFLAGIGFAYAACHACPAPQWIHWIYDILPDVKPDKIWHIFAIYCVGAGLGSILVSLLMHLLASVLKVHAESEPDVLTSADIYAPGILGLLESIAYPTALFMCQPAFIGLWLGLKVAGTWVRWKGEQVSATQDSDGQNRAPVRVQQEKLLEEQNLGRRIFNRFLIGNLLCLFVGVAIYTVAKLWIEAKCP